MEKNFIQKAKEKTLIIDGAMGTMLQDAGLKQGECSEEWNLSHPEIIIDIHCQYIKAGADIILTNTFGGSPIKLRASNLEHKMGDINTTAVSLAKKAVGHSLTKREIFIAGDIGPCGEFLEPIGTASKRELYSNFKSQVDVLARAGIDLIIIETMTSIEEAEVCLKAAKESGLPVIVSMSFNKDAEGNGFHTMMGVSPENMVERLSYGGASALGTNCGMTGLEMEDVVKHLKKLTQLPLMAEPNAGIPKLIDGNTVYDLAPEEMGKIAVRLKEAGASLIGGCCGTTPRHIAAVSKALGQL